MELTIIIGAIITFFEVAGIISALDAIMKTRTSQGAIAWAVSLVTMPFIVVPLYWIFGRNKFRGYVKLRNSADTQARQVINGIKKIFRERDVIDDAAQYRNAVALTNMSDMPMTRFNRADLLIDGRETFESIFAGIDSARDYILIQFFIVHDDVLGKRLQQSLARQARAGVRVYFLFDEIGCHKLSTAYLDEMRKAGIEALPFGTTKGRTNKFQLNFRNHRKIVVVDGRSAWVGGHNVGDEYLGESARFGPWRDTHVKVTGPAVQGAQYSFLEDWYWAGATIPELNWVPDADGTEGILSQVVASGPADNLDTCGLMFVHAFNSARKRVWIASPYFVPDRQTLTALQLAALRGVDVRILLPEKPDHLLVYLASFSYYGETLPVGIEIYRYTSGFMHQKVMLVDDSIAGVGTANFDNRSFRLNFEITMVFFDNPFAGKVERMLENDFANSRRVTMADVNERFIGFKVLTRLARLMSPIL
ncbi:MAG: cardiolipin synthase [Thermodesulfobacteriota bacterium]